VEERYGAAAAQVLMKVATLGHARISDVEKSFDLSPKRPNGLNGIRDSLSSTSLNGSSKAHQEELAHSETVKSVPHLHHLLDTLLKSGFICLASQYDYKTDEELDDDATLHIYSQYPGGQPKGKEKAEAAAEVNRKKREWRDQAYSEIVEAELPRKRRKAEGALSNGTTGHSLDESQTDHLLPEKELDVNFRLSVWKTVSCREELKSNFHRMNLSFD
jgi:hypothetical protein